MVGAILWKVAKKGGFKKWMGIAMVGVGLLFLLPKILLIPIIVIGAYVAFKNKKSKETTVFSYSTDGQAVTKNSDYLDQWEHKMKTEE